MSATFALCAIVVTGVVVSREFRGPSLPPASGLSVPLYLIGWQAEIGEGLRLGAGLSTPRRSGLILSKGAGACGFALEENTVLGLYDDMGTLITSNDDIDATALNFCSRISTTLEPGTYYLGVFGSSGGVYAVSAREAS